MPSSLMATQILRQYKLMKLLFRRITFTTLLASALYGCASDSEVDEKIKNVQVPEHWQNQTNDLSIKNNWLSELTNPQVLALVDQALKQNYDLRQKAYQVEINQQELIRAGSELWPELDLSFQASRNKDNDPVSYSNSSSVSLDLSYELDVWGKLSDYERQANLNLLSTQASYHEQKQQLVVEVVTTWFSLIEAEKLLALYENRVANSQQSLDIIEHSYHQGLSDALDVYLARNELNTELTRVSAQKTSLKKISRALERLVGDYPYGKLVVNAKLPLLISDIPLGLPSELISRKPSLKAQWYQVLAQDAGLAYAHKQRFPRIAFGAQVGDSQNDVDQLFSGSSLAWSLLGNISMPLFNAGNLEANEQIARLTLKQKEQAYLDSLYEAFADVENAVSNEEGLKYSYRTVLAAQENAMTAATLSFEQYQNGLVSYTTVLDAQDRSYDAQTTLIKIKNELIANRIQLHLALGGDFSDPAITAEEP